MAAARRHYTCLRDAIEPASLPPLSPPPHSGFSRFSSNGHTVLARRLLPRRRPRRGLEAAKAVLLRAGPCIRNPGPEPHGCMEVLEHAAGGGLPTGKSMDRLFYSKSLCRSTSFSLSNACAGGFEAKARTRERERERDRESVCVRERLYEEKCP